MRFAARKQAMTLTMMNLIYKYIMLEKNLHLLQHKVLHNPKYLLMKYYWFIVDKWFINVNKSASV